MIFSCWNALPVTLRHEVVKHAHELHALPGNGAGQEDGGQAVAVDVASAQQDVVHRAHQERALLDARLLEDSRQILNVTTSKLYKHIITHPRGCTFKKTQAFELLSS